MSSDVEHMLTNITLWLSSKPCGLFAFVLQSPEPQESRVIKIRSFNYNSARERIVNYLQSLGTIDNIQYSHKHDWYEIHVLKDNEDNQNYNILRTYTLYYTVDKTIEI